MHTDLSSPWLPAWWLDVEALSDYWWQAGMEHEPQEAQP